MAHELTIREDGTSEMAFVGETPWHGLGQQLTPGSPIEVWCKEAGMDWEVVGQPVLYSYGDDLKSYTGYQVFSRSDNGNPLAVVSDKFKVVQPREILEFFREYVEVAGLQLHTAGTLFGGTRFWALAKIESGLLNGDDNVDHYLQLATAVDGSMNTIAKDTTIRTVCNNTLTLALRETGRTEIRVSHRANFDHSKVKEQLAESRSAFGDFMKVANQLARLKVEDAKAREFVSKLLTEVQVVSAKEVEKTSAFINIISNFSGNGLGANMKTAKGTAWGLLNSVTQYIDYQTRARDKSNALASAWFGFGEKVKNEAAARLMDLVAA